MRSPAQLFTCSSPRGKPAVAFLFENIEVYQKAVDFADQIAATTEGFLRGYGFLVDQSNRAALSIATNLAEGNGRFAKPAAGTSSSSLAVRFMNVFHSLKWQNAMTFSPTMLLRNCVKSLKRWAR